MSGCIEYIYVLCSIKCIAKNLDIFLPHKMLAMVVILTTLKRIWEMTSKITFTFVEQLFGS